MLLRNKGKLTLVGLLVAGGAAAAAALGPAGLAVGQASIPLQMQIQVNSPATLAAKGAGVDVTVTTQCSGSAPGTGSALVFLTERVGSDIATGGGSVPISCTGAPQTYVVLVTASPTKAFKKGSAIAEGTINACNAALTFCNSQEVTTTIEIDK